MTCKVSATMKSFFDRGLSITTTVALEPKHHMNGISMSCSLKRELLATVSTVALRHKHNMNILSTMIQVIVSTCFAAFAETFDVLPFGGSVPYRVQSPVLA